MQFIQFLFLAVIHQHLCLMRLPIVNIAGDTQTEWTGNTFVKSAERILHPESSQGYLFRTFAKPVSRQ